MENVPIIDATGLQTFWDLMKKCERNHTRLILCQVRPNILEKMQRAGIAQKMGEENIIRHIHMLNVPV
jgi:SulP family sulfate permease